MRHAQAGITTSGSGAGRSATGCCGCCWPRREGVRLGEALGLQHRDWHTGRGDTLFIEVVARDHPHGVRTKSGYRRLYVSDELDRLYGEYVWQLCEAGADLATEDFDLTCIFVNLDREPRFAPWRAESVYDLVERLRRQLSGQVPQAWTPHWMRHSHATALQMSRIATGASFGISRECPLPAPQRVRPSAEVGVRSGTNHRDLRCHHSGCTKRHDEAPSMVARGDDMMRRKQQGQASTRAGAATVRSVS